MPGSYVVTETTAPAGYGLDSNPSRNVTVAHAEDAVIGVQGMDDSGETDGSDFHDPLGSVAWEKRNTGGNLWQSVPRYARSHDRQRLDDRCRQRGQRCRSEPRLDPGQQCVPRNLHHHRNRRADRTPATEGPCPSSGSPSTRTN